MSAIFQGLVVSSGEKEPREGNLMVPPGGGWADIFAVNIAAYAVMSNHYHLVLHIDKARVEEWSDEEVCRRWGRLYRGPELLQHFLNGEPLAVHEQTELKQLVRGWRSRLCCLSHFMACLNYVIALRANKEDGCTGRFWEGRFKSQALKDETALLACMTYVDLNPVRAGMAKDLPSSDFTSIQDRILRAAHKKSKGTKPRLMPFAEVEKQTQKKAAIPFRYRDYLELVDWYGRDRHARKKGFIRAEAPKLLSVLGLSAQLWNLLSKEIEKESNTLLHGLEKLETLERRALREVA